MPTVSYSPYIVTLFCNNGHRVIIKYHQNLEAETYHKNQIFYIFIFLWETKIYFYFTSNITDFFNNY